MLDLRRGNDHRRRRVVNAPKSDDTIAVSVVLAPASETREGLLAWAVVEIARAIRCDGLTVRRTQSERPRLMVSWPRRRDANGEMHLIVTIMDAKFRRRVEAEVLASYLDAVRSAEGGPS